MKGMFLQSIAQKTRLQEAKVEALNRELENNMAYLRFLKLQLKEFSEESLSDEQNTNQSSQDNENNGILIEPAPPQLVPNPSTPVKSSPVTNKQFEITLMFIALTFTFVMLFSIMGGMEGAKTAWLMLGPTLSVVIYPWFKRKQ
jgi:hypothetical protein